jgi:hypothetical protein
MALGRGQSGRGFRCRVVSNGARILRRHAMRGKPTRRQLFTTEPGCRRSHSARTIGLGSPGITSHGERDNFLRLYSEMIMGRFFRLCSSCFLQTGCLQVVEWTILRITWRILQSCFSLLEICGHPTCVGRGWHLKILHINHSNCLKINRVGKLVIMVGFQVY